MEIKLTKSEFQELLAMLYLRLNGYFTSGFIVHAPRDNRTQIDILAVRFPYHAEPEREIACSPWLQIPPLHTDILICEVKGQNTQLRFNAAFRDNTESIRSVLRWIGIIDERAMDQVVDELQEAIRTEQVQTPEAFKGISIQDRPGIIVPCLSIRGVLFAPDRGAPARNQLRFVYGQEMIDYIWACYCPAERRPESATRYDFNLWGIYHPIVRYFKDLREDGKTSGTMQNLYDHFNL